MKSSYSYLARACSYAALIAAPAAAQEPEAFVFRDLKYDAVVDYKEPKLTGSITYQLENYTRRPATEISFLLNRLMEASKVTDASGRSLPFTQDVKRFLDTPMRQVTLLNVKLARPVPPGARTSLKIDYSGYLVGYTEIGWLYVKDHIDTTFTIIREDALAFPVIGNLSDKANRKRPYPDFTYEASVRVPSKYLVALGGTVSRTVNSDGTTTWHYDSVKPTSVMNISIAPFDTLIDKRVRVFYFPNDSLGARRLMAKTKAALDTFTSWFGPLHSNTSLTITEIPNGWGSQASLVGGIIQTASAFQNPSSLGEVYHELSHLWNAPETENPSSRYNEGLATFLESLLPEQMDADTTRKAYEAWMLGRIKTNLTNDSTLKVVPFADYGKTGITNWSYRVGDVMFSTLHSLVGDQEFKKLIGGFYQKYADGGTTKDFTNYVIQNSSHDLKMFFDDWMYTTRWTQLIADAKSVAELAAHYRGAT